MIPYLILLLVLYNRLTIVLKIALAYLQNSYISFKFSTTLNYVLTVIHFILTLINHFFPSNLGIIIETVLGNIH